MYIREGVTKFVYLIAGLREFLESDTYVRIQVCVMCIDLYV